MQHDINSVITAAVIPAAGFGSRMGADIPKQFLNLDGESILQKTVGKFLDHPAIRHIAIAVPSEYRPQAEQLFLESLPGSQKYRLIFTNGGATRQESVLAGMNVLPLEVDVVLVHDGARPMIDAGIIDRCLHGVLEHGAVIAGIPVKDTLKKVNREHLIEATIDRSELWQAQTPQAAWKKLLDQAYRKAMQDGFTGTDEASLLEHAGIKVGVVMGSEKNLKVTRPDDLALLAGLLEKRAPMKIGHGYDAHQLVKHRKLILGGVDIPHEFGLLGHSDADVLTHALMDAVFGAMGKGDIGKHFPDSDKQYKDINSLELLLHTVAAMHDQNLKLGNADLTIVCQKPKLAPYMETMRRNLAEICSVDPSAINIKATTTEKMGFTGRCEGISAHAVVLLISNR